LKTWYRSDHSIFRVSARLGDWSRRMPEIQASYGWSALTSGSTLRMWQHRSGSRSQRFAPSARCCSAIVGIEGAEEEVRIEFDRVHAQAELGDHVHEHGRLLLPRARQADARPEEPMRPSQ